MFDEAVINKVNVGKTFLITSEVSSFAPDLFADDEEDMIKLVDLYEEAVLKYEQELYERQQLRRKELERHQLIANEAKKQKKKRVIDEEEEKVDPPAPHDQTVPGTETQGVTSQASLEEEDLEEALSSFVAPDEVSRRRQETVTEKTDREQAEMEQEEGGSTLAAELKRLSSAHDR